MASLLTKFFLSMGCAASAINVLSAKDLGICGHLFPIYEESLLESLKTRIGSLSNEELEVVKNTLQRRYSSYLRSPNPVPGVKKAMQYRLFYLDPSLCADREIKDHRGNLIVPKGKCINPLEIISYLDDLLFFDGTDTAQVDWAKTAACSSKWILTSGKPLELEEREERPVYFDQSGILIEKFGIQQLPARVSRDGFRIRIEEIPLGGDACAASK